MSSQKYEIITSDAKFTAYFSLKDNVIVPEKTDDSCVKVYRIRALKDISYSHCVDAGELGGWVESEYNLSQTDGCWISPDAVAVGRARVSMNAHLYSGCVARDFAQVSGNSEVWMDSVVRDHGVVTDYARIKNNTVVSGNGVVGDRADLDNSVVRGGFVGGHTFSRVPCRLYVVPADGESPVVAVDNDNPSPFCSSAVISSGVVKSPFDVISTTPSEKELFTYNRTNGQIAQLVFDEDGHWRFVSVSDKPICERSLHGEERLEQYAEEVGEKVVYGKGSDLKYEIVESERSSSATLRVRALRSIPEHGVEAGALGGFVNSYSCLSQTGSCWVANNASVKDSKVRENALVCDDAYVHQGSVVSGNATLGNKCEIVHSVVKGNVTVDIDATLVRTLADGKVTVKGAVKCVDCKIYGGGTLRSKMADGSTVWTYDGVLVCVCQEIKSRRTKPWTSTTLYRG